MKTLIAIAVVVTSAPLIAAVAEEGAAPPKERMVCRRVDAISGTRVARRRVCMPAAQWRARSDNSTDDALDALRVMSGGDTPAGTRLSRGGTSPSPN